MQAPPHKETLAAEFGFRHRMKGFMVEKNINRKKAKVGFEDHKEEKL